MRTIKKCGECGSDVTWIGCTPTGDKYICNKRCCVTPSVMVEVVPDEDVTHCEVCGKQLDAYANAKTCSARCRVALHRKNKRQESEKA